MLKHETIFLVVGESGSGKTTLCNQLSKLHGAIQLWSYTTRPARYVDEPGHHFVSSMERWRDCRPHDTVVAYTHFNGYDYWATDAQVDNSDLYVIDPAGVEFFRKTYRGDKDIVVIYVDVSWCKRLQRMRCRGDTLLRSMERIWHDIKAFWGYKRTADFVVCNDDMQAAVQTMWDIMYEVDGNKNKPYAGNNIPVERVNWRGANG